MKKTGFTLAEVLITLAIIGVVAALTIPSVIANAQQQEFKTGLKKAVSVLNEAIQMNISQEGETPYENKDLFFYIQRHMSITKSNINSEGFRREFIINGQATEDANRFFYTNDGMRFEMPNVGSQNIERHLYLHESGIDIGTKLMDLHGYGAFVGSNIAFCGSYGLKNNSHNTVYTPCVILVDVNGDRKPNPRASMKTRIDPNFGQEVSYYGSDYLYPSPTDKKLTDIFNILITEEKAIPFGVVAQRAMYSK